MSVERGPGPITPLPLEPPDDERRRAERKERRRRRRRRERNREKVAAPRESPRPRPRKRHVGRWVAVLILIVIAAAAIAPITMWNRYRMTYVTSRNAAIKGSITHVGAQLEGVIASVEVDAGQHVTAGQVLARFDNHQLQANVVRMQSRLSEARARASSAQARIEAAQSQSHEAKVVYDQKAGLAETGAISRDELRTAETRLRTAEAMEKTSVADFEAAGAEANTVEAELALSRADVDAAVIRAPADGWVVRRISEPGTSVVVGQSIVDLWIGKEVWVEAWIDEDLLSQVVVGSDVKVTVNSFPGRAFKGKVESIGVSTDFELPEAAVPQSRTERIRTTPVVPVRVRLEEREGLFPGLSAVVAIQRKVTR